MSTPEAVLLKALRARDEWRYADVVALVDPEARDANFASFCDMVQPLTMERFADQYPDLAGDELTRAFERRSEHMAHVANSIPRSVPGVETYEELVALDAADFLKRRLEREDHRFDLLERLRARGRAIPQKLLSAREGLEHVAIGSVYETDSLVHVLYRQIAQLAEGGIHRGPVEYEALQRQSSGEWRLLMSTNNFLSPRGSSIWILDDEFADLWDLEPGVGMIDVRIG